MICRRCLGRAAGLAARHQTPSQPPARLLPPTARTFTTSRRARNASPSPPAAAPVPPAATTASAEAATTTTTPHLTPLGPPSPPGAGAANAAAPLSSCAAGTPLNGLNYFKGKTDPVALPDEAYPAWLWKCLEVQKKAGDAGDANAGDEFSKSKKQRRLALKRQRQQEAKLLASGDLEALVPKVPLQKQSVNLPAAEGGSLEEALAAADTREELRRAMRKERRAKIKESNYLKAM